MAERTRTHAIVFDCPERTLAAARRLTAAGFHVVDVHSPFPVHGMDAAIGFAPTRVPWATFAGGVTGATAAVLVQLWTHAVDWPLNIGGKTFTAIPAIVPVTFELTVLLAAFATVGALFVRSRLLPTWSGRQPASQPHARVNDDRFVILVAESDASFSAARFRDLCAELAPLEVVDTWRMS